MTAKIPDPNVVATTNLNLSRLTSTPSHHSVRSYKKLNTQSSSHTLFSHVNSSRSSLARNYKLHHQPSKLDLIDDTTLTSLPLPPPLKVKSRGSGSSTSSLPRHDSAFETELDPDSSISDIADTTNDYDDEETNDPIVLIEDYMTNETEPSSLVEDDSTINRKQSLATFKQRINNSLQARPSFYSQPSFGASVEIDNISEVSTIATVNNDTFNSTEVDHSSDHDTSSPKPNNKRSITEFRPYGRSENLEEIFGRIPGSETLKHCDLCEKPLYEISSILNNKKKMKTSSCITSTTNTNAVSHLLNEAYTEFICGECVETYEDFFNELYQSELHQKECKKQSNDNTNDNEKCNTQHQHDNTTHMNLLDIFKSIEAKYAEQQQEQQQQQQHQQHNNNTQESVTAKRSFYQKMPTYKQLNNKTSFSETLMARLSYLNSIPEGYLYNSNNLTPNIPRYFKTVPKTIDLEWIKKIQSKLRWWGNYRQD